MLTREFCQGDRVSIGTMVLHIESVSFDVCTLALYDGEELVDRWTLRHLERFHMDASRKNYIEVIAPRGRRVRLGFNLPRSVNIDWLSHA